MFAFSGDRICITSQNLFGCYSNAQFQNPKLSHSCFRRKDKMCKDIREKCHFKNIFKRII